MNCELTQEMRDHEAQIRRVVAGDVAPVLYAAGRGFTLIQAPMTPEQILRYRRAQR